MISEGEVDELVAIQRGGLYLGIYKVEEDDETVLHLLWYDEETHEIENNVFYYSTAT